MGPSRGNPPATVCHSTTLRTKLAETSTAEAVRRAIEAYPLPGPEAWAIAADHIRAFDGRMVDELVSIPRCVAPLANNPHLTGRHLQRLALWAVRASGDDDSFEPDAPLRVLYHLAQDGRLGRFPFLLRLLVHRIRVLLGAEPDAYTRARLLIETLLACPTLPVDVLIELDGRMVAYGLFPERRAEIARHPSAGFSVWRAMLQHEPAAEVVRVIAGNGRAMQDPVIRATVEA